MLNTVFNTTSDEIFFSKKNNIFSHCRKVILFITTISILNFSLISPSSAGNNLLDSKSFAKFESKIEKGCVEESSRAISGDKDAVMLFLNCEKKIVGDKYFSKYLQTAYYNMIEANALNYLNTINRSILASSAMFSKDGKILPNSIKDSFKEVPPNKTLMRVESKDNYKSFVLITNKSSYSSNVAKINFTVPEFRYYVNLDQNGVLALGYVNIFGKKIINKNFASLKGGR